MTTVICAEIDVMSFGCKAVATHGFHTTPLPPRLSDVSVCVREREREGVELHGVLT